jgi:hypothetical protein
MTTRHENPKHVQGDGAGFNRLRAAQKMRETFAAICQRSHPSSTIYVDQVREYAGAQVVFYRVTDPELPEQARIALFQWVNPTATKGGEWHKQNDIIAATA